MKEEKYIDHEVRIRLLEELMKKVDHKMNVSLSLIVGSIIIPIAIKSLGWL